MPQGAIARILGEEVRPDFGTDDGVAAAVQLAQLQQSAQNLAVPNVLRCALCDEVMSPADGKIDFVQDEKVMNRARSRFTTISLTARS